MVNIGNIGNIGNIARDQGLNYPAQGFNIDGFDGKISWMDAFRLAAGAENSFLTTANQKIQALNEQIQAKTTEENTTMLGLHNRRVEILDLINEAKEVQAKYEGVYKPNAFMRFIASIVRRFVTPGRITGISTMPEERSMYAKIGAFTEGEQDYEVRAYRIPYGDMASEPQHAIGIFKKGSTDGARTLFKNSRNPSIRIFVANGLLHESNIVKNTMKEDESNGEYLEINGFLGAGRTAKEIKEPYRRPLDRRLAQITSEILHQTAFAKSVAFNTVYDDAFVLEDAGFVSHVGKQPNKGTVDKARADANDPEVFPAYVDLGGSTRFMYRDQVASIANPILFDTAGIVPIYSTV
ncbi:MAG: hypothetical protein P0S94_04370 [Simkaniaceae bacterium]|nr:hypothetical protein [Simkaniaceae bacterium]